VEKELRGHFRAARCDNAMSERPLCFFSAVYFFISFFIRHEISAVSPPIAAKLPHATIAT